jgi:hypothetical protein
MTELVHNDFKKEWKEMTMLYFEVPSSGNMPRGTKENQEKFNQDSQSLYQDFYTFTLYFLCFYTLEEYFNTNTKKA